MMKKLMMLISLLLCAALTPFAAAQEAYVPGENARTLIEHALQSGQMLQGYMRLRLDMDGAVLGLDEEEQALLDAVSRQLSNVTLSAAAGKTGDGVRIELAAALADPQGGEPVVVDAAANLSLTGVSLESGLLPGRRITSRWETLMAMAGMNDSDILMLLSLRDMDWDTIMPQLLAAAEQGMLQAMALLAPYEATVIDWINGLHAEIAEDVPAGNGYPAAAAEVTVTITQRDLGELLARLAGQVKADESLCLLMNMFIQEAYTGEGEAPDASQYCDEVIRAAESLTDTDNPVLLLVGVNESDTPLYAQVCVVSGGQAAAFADVIAYEDESGAVPYQLSLMTFDDAGEVENGVMFAGTASGSAFTLESVAYAAGEQVMAMQYALSSAPAQGEQAGLTIEQSAAAAVDDGTQVVQTVMSASAKCMPMEDGGEIIDETMSMEIAIGEETYNVIALETLCLFPDGEGMAGSYSAAQHMPEIGVEAVGMDVMLSTHAYDLASAAALRETAFETSSRADIDELIGALTASAQEKFAAASQAIDPQLLALLMEL